MDQLSIDNIYIIAECGVMAACVKSANLYIELLSNLCAEET